MTAQEQLDIKQSLRAKWLTELNNGLQDPLSRTEPILTEPNLLPTVLNFTAAYPSFSRALFERTGLVKPLGTGIGRGEALLYFIYDNVSLGGTTSNIDIYVSGVPYIEVKAVNRRGQLWVDLRLGTDEFTASLQLLHGILELMLRQEQKGKLQVPEHYGNIPKSMLDKLKKQCPTPMARLEAEYFARLFNGRAGRKLYLLFDIETMLPIYFGKLEQDQLQLERFSMGQTKLLFNPQGFSNVTHNNTV
jgi:hypothetical protein